MLWLIYIYVNIFLLNLLFLIIDTQSFFFYALSPFVDKNMLQKCFIRVI